MTKFYVTYPSRFSKNGRVHKLTCDYAQTSHGQKLSTEQLATEAPEAEDCKVCGGAT